MSQNNSLCYFPTKLSCEKKTMEKCFDFYIKYGEADSAIPNFIKGFGFNFGSAVRK